MLDIVVRFVKMYPALDRYQNNFIEKAVMNSRGPHVQEKRWRRAGLEKSLNRRPRSS